MDALRKLIGSFRDKKPPEKREETLEQKFPLNIELIKIAFKAKLLFGCQRKKRTEEENIPANEIQQEHILGSIYRDASLNKNQSAYNEKDIYLASGVKGYNYWKELADDISSKLDERLTKAGIDSNQFMSKIGADEVFNENDIVHTTLEKGDLIFKKSDELFELKKKEAEREIAQRKIDTGEAGKFSNFSQQLKDLIYVKTNLTEFKKSINTFNNHAEEAFKDRIYKFGFKMGKLGKFATESYYDSCPCIKNIRGYVAIDLWFLEYYKSGIANWDDYHLNLCDTYDNNITGILEVDPDEPDSKLPDMVSGETHYPVLDKEGKVVYDKEGNVVYDDDDELPDMVSDERDDAPDDAPDGKIVGSDEITGGGDTNNVTLLLIICVVLILLHFVVKKPAFFIAVLLTVVVYSKLAL